MRFKLSLFIATTILTVGFCTVSAGAIIQNNDGTLTIRDCTLETKYSVAPNIDTTVTRNTSTLNHACSGSCNARHGIAGSIQLFKDRDTGTPMYSVNQHVTYDHSQGNTTGCNWNHVSSSTFISECVERFHSANNRFPIKPDTLRYYHDGLVSSNPRSPNITSASNILVDNVNLLTHSITALRITNLPRYEISPYDPGGQGPANLQGLDYEEFKSITFISDGSVTVRNSTCDGRLTVATTHYQDLLVDNVKCSALSSSHYPGNITYRNVQAKLNVYASTESGKLIVDGVTGEPNAQFTARGDYAHSIKNLNVSGFDLTFTSTAKPEDMAARPGGTSSSPVAVVDKALIRNVGRIRGTPGSYIYLKQLTAQSDITITDTTAVIDGGTFKGSPAITGTDITVKRGVFTDLNGRTSQFMIDSESESQVTTSGDKTITTVKLSNPPVSSDGNSPLVVV